MDDSFLCTLVYKECVKVLSKLAFVKCKQGADCVFAWVSLCVTATLLTEPHFFCFHFGKEENSNKEASFFVSSICKEKMHSWDHLLFKRYVAAFP